MGVVHRIRVGLLLAALLGSAPAGAQGIAPPHALQGYAVGAFNVHGSQDIVRGLPEQGAQRVWVRHDIPSVLFAAIDLAERNSVANFPAAGPYPAAVSTDPDAALAAGRGDFLLVLVVPWTDRFGVEASLATLHVTGPLEPLERDGVPVESVFYSRMALADPAMPAAPEEASESVEPVVRGLASGALALDPFLDGERGLLWLRYLEGGADGSPEEQSAERLCGEALGASHERIRQALSAFVERADEWEMGMTCDAQQCVVGGMEWTPSLYATFARDASGALRLQSIQERSEALLSEEWFEPMEAWVAARMAELHASPCGPL